MYRSEWWGEYMETYVCSVCNPGRNDTRYKTITRGDKKIRVYLPPKGEVKIVHSMIMWERFIFNNSLR